MSDEFITITKAAYDHITAVITQLRWVRQNARELLEQGRIDEAKSLLAKTEEE